MTIAQHAAKYGMSEHTVRSRINRGMGLKAALTTTVETAKTRQRNWVGGRGWKE